MPPLFRNVARTPMLAGTWLFLLSSGCDQTSEVIEAGTNASASRLTTVAVSHPIRKMVRTTTVQPGEIQAVEETPIHAKLNGYVRNLKVDIGDHVKQDQVLAEIWVPELDAELKNKRALIEQAETELRQIEAEGVAAEATVASVEAVLDEIRCGAKRLDTALARWGAEFSRVSQSPRDRSAIGALMDEFRKKLTAIEVIPKEPPRTGQGDSAQTALSTLRQAYRNKARADRDVGLAGIEAARSSLEQSEVLSAYTRIRAPYAGTITRRHVDSGYLTAQNSALFDIARSDASTIVVFVPEMAAPYVHAGDKAEIRIQAMANRTLPAKVSRTSWSLDRTTRTLRVEIDLVNTYDFIRPGLYVSVAIIAEEHPQALTIPTTALFRQVDTTYCVCISGDKATRRPVERGFTDGPDTEILSGLEGEETVVTANAASLVEGQPVQPVPTTSSPGRNPPEPRQRAGGTLR